MNLSRLVGAFLACLSAILLTGCATTPLAYAKGVSGEMSDKLEAWTDGESDGITELLSDSIGVDVYTVRSNVDSRFIAAGPLGDQCLIVLFSNSRFNEGLSASIMPRYESSSTEVLLLNGTTEEAEAFVAAGSDSC